MDLIPWKNKRDRSELSRREGYVLPRLRTDIDRLFDRFFQDFWGDEDGGRLAGLMAGTRTDLSESDNDVCVRVELPGVDPKDVEVNLEGNVLTISGEKKEEKEDKRRDYQYVERQFGSFRRSIQLPGYVDPEHVEATFKNGVLTVTLPKKPEAKPKTIEVKTK